MTLYSSVLAKDLLDSNQHILIAGTTGSGKSVLINEIIYGLLAHSSPDYTMMLIDPKKVELNMYRNTYHCISYADTDISAVRDLTIALQMIEIRLKQMQTQGIKTYQGGYIFIIIDELADLLLSPYGALIKKLLQKILQIGRATKTFVISATQIPARKILDAGLMLNFGIRIALRCNDKIESRQIIGTDDACRLPKYGVIIVKGLYADQPMYCQELLLRSDAELQERANIMHCGNKYTPQFTQDEIITLAKKIV